MPLVRFEVRNEYGLGDPELYRGASKRDDPKALLDGIAVAGLVGILRQLGDLAEFAADVFHDLHEQVMVTASRGHKLLSRIHHIEEALPSLEKAVQGQTSHIHFAYVPGTDWQANLRTEKSLLLSSDMPRFMLDSYEECRDPPRLYLLDKFDSGGPGACLKRYSDPSYFTRVCTTSEAKKSEMAQRERKAKKNKIKGSQLRNGEVQNSVYMSGQNSSSIHFASPSTDAQSLPNTDAQNLSTENVPNFDMRVKPELASGSTSFGSKTRLSFVDEVSDANHSVIPDEEEFDKLSVSKLQIDHSDSCASVLHDESNGDIADDDSHHDSLQGSVHIPPYVTWDEKTEITKPTSTSSKSCEDILVDRILDSEPLSVTSRSSNIDVCKTSNHEALEEEGILPDIPHPFISVSGGNHFDEITSETDNYMDALNTLESETETDSEYQTKREVNSLSNLGYQGMESRTGQVHGTTAINSDSSDIETPMASHQSLSKDPSPISSILGSSESSEPMQPLLTDAFVPNFNISPSDDFSKSVPNTSLMKDFEGTSFELSPGSSILNSQTTSAGETTSESSILNLQTTSAGETTSESSILNSQTILAGETTSELSIRNSQEMSGCETTGFPFDTSGMPPTKFWTNGGLFGVEPSKPPDFNVLNIANENVVSDSKNTGHDLSSEKLTAKSQCGEIHNVAPSDPSTSSPSDNDIFDTQNPRESVQALASNLINGLQDNSFQRNYDHMTKPDQKKIHTAHGVELPDINHIGSQSVPNMQGISSSFSGLAQRFLANSLRRKSLVTHDDDISIASRMPNADMRKAQEACPQSKHKEPGTPCKENAKEKNEQESFRKSASFSSRYFGNSSPPLEHMKISFHPMNGLETSKLKLEFPNGNLHESIEELMFPSFKLLPGHAHPLPDSGSESDDDTFCRSCPYSSEDNLSPRSDSNSELWEKDEMSGSKEDEMHNDLHRASSSPVSNYSFMGFDPSSHCNIDSAIGFGNLETEDGMTTFISAARVADLPGLESVISSKEQREEQCVSMLINNANELPPPPPLPPVQWMVLKPSPTAETIGHFDGSQAQRFSVTQQQEHIVAKQSRIYEAMAAYSKKTQDPQNPNGNKELFHQIRNMELKGSKELNNGVSKKKIDEREELLHQIRNTPDQKKLNGHDEPKELDEREDLLHQIRNKTFNLRRTTASKPSLMPQPTTNVNVAAILEKANAIRQAFVGSDEGGDDDEDDNWSDD